MNRKKKDFNTLWNKTYLMEVDVAKQWVIAKKTIIKPESLEIIVRRFCKSPNDTDYRKMRAFLGLENKITTVNEGVIDLDG